MEKTPEKIASALEREPSLAEHAANKLIKGAGISLEGLMIYTTLASAQQAALTKQLEERSRELSQNGDDMNARIVSMVLTLLDETGPLFHKEDPDDDSK